MLPTATHAPTQGDQLRKPTCQPPWGPVGDDLFMTSQQVENHRLSALSLLGQRFLKQVVIVAQPADPGFKTGFGSFKTGVGSFDALIRTSYRSMAARRLSVSADMNLSKTLGG